MPRGDGTGPDGFGPMTGRAAGYCAGYGMPGFNNYYGGRRGMGYGRGMGYRGGGRGWRNMYYATGLPYWARYGQPPGGRYVQPIQDPSVLTPENEIDMLRGEARAIENELKSIHDRIGELESIAEKKE